MYKLVLTFHKESRVNNKQIIKERLIRIKVIFKYIIRKKHVIYEAPYKICVINYMKQIIIKKRKYVIKYMKKIIIK